MSEYEFWNELGNIFNAVVAYQQKTIEFNKRFVNPWIRLGTVFDKDDRNAESVSAYQKAIEIDPQNAANWQALGDVYFKMGSFEDAATAYGRSIELDPRCGWAYTNLALTFATQQKYTEAINLYVKSLEFLTDDKDRAMTWNRLGNVYRKVNDYENAFIAFQRADECDAENTGFTDQLDDTSEQVVVAMEGELPIVMDEIVIPEALAVKVNEEDAPISIEDEQPEQAETTEANSIAEAPIVETVETSVETADESVVMTEDTPVGEMPVETAEAIEVAESAVVEVVAEVEQAMEEPVVVDEPVAEIEQPIDASAVVDEPSVVAEQMVEVPVAVEEPVVAAEETVVESAPEAVSEEVVSEESQPEAVAEIPAVETSETALADVISIEISSETTVTAVLMHTVETIADASALNQPAVVVVDVPLEIDATPAEASVEVPAQEVVMEEPVVETQAVETEPQTEVQVEAGVIVEPAAEMVIQSETDVVVEETSETVVEVVVQETVETTETIAVAEVQPEVEVETAPVSEADAQSNESIIQEIISLTVDGKAKEVAYEEFLKDSAQPVLVNDEKELDAPVRENPAEPVAVKNEVKVELDTKNAHVWNELGNVYFNSGAYEEAITAYGKAIELDGWFAWPYSNLALAYVQKEKYAEAVLLYQRSIELFSSDKDKAVTWNRLGNVYRRLNDYDNAIASYQRADELDPNNATRSLRSRFSLLGSFNLDQSPSFVA